MERMPGLWSDLDSPIEATLQQIYDDRESGKNLTSYVMWNDQVR